MSRPGTQPSWATMATYPAGTLDWSSNVAERAGWGS